MRSRLLPVVLAEDAATRDLALETLADPLGEAELLAECAALDEFRRDAANLYQRVRALFFLSALHRYHLPRRYDARRAGRVRYAGYVRLLERRFEEAIERFLAQQEEEGASDAVSSALAAAYHRLAFQTLADQVRASVRAVRGNRWMFRVGHPADHPLRIHPRLRVARDARYPVLVERTPVRMDLSHSAWSDIFFLGMDHSEGAKVLNISVDLAVRGRHQEPAPPVTACLRVLDRPVLRLVSTDLEASAEITDLDEVFDFARDHLGLLKAGLIAAGIVPPGVEGSGAKLETLLDVLVGPGLGLELVTCVRDIPKGSRLAVSTTLLAAVLAVSMRATSQTRHLEGPLEESERRLVAARAILGEWLGGSGGGWQDSGGVWPGFKCIEGVRATEADPEHGKSRGRLLPSHRILGEDEVPPATRRALTDSLVLVHGGMAQNVGPVLEMVTEKYLLRSAEEWRARKEALSLFDQMRAALRSADLRELGRLTTANFLGPIRTIVPWASNAFTETLIEAMRADFGEEFWGFWMLGGMSGGGMGFLFDPKVKDAARERLAARLAEERQRFGACLPFAMEPVVYDFAVDDQGTVATLEEGADALLPAPYYRLTVPELLRTDRDAWGEDRVQELAALADAVRGRDAWRDELPALLDRLLPSRRAKESDAPDPFERLRALGFDPSHHEQVRADLRSGRIGLAQNRLPRSTRLGDVLPEDVIDCRGPANADDVERGRAALRAGAVATVTLAAGAASRWTQGAGVVKALHPFARLQGRFRSFLDVHVAKSRRRGRQAGVVLPHVLTTSHFTHGALEEALGRADLAADDLVRLSPGRAVGLRLVPTERDLRFAWMETRQEILDERAQKVKEGLHQALIAWARRAGEGSDYTDNLFDQCLHPVGHWYEVPNLLQNGVLADLLEERPSLEVLFVHNVDTLGADVDPAMLGRFLATDHVLAFEVVPRRIEDRGGGLARVDGRPRLVESLALPREEDEFALSYYNSLSTWVRIDRLLQVFGLVRGDLRDTERVRHAVRDFADRMPTYVTLKDVKKRWGNAQEDVFPVAQFEKLWGDMSARSEVDCGFFVVPRSRGQQLKDPAQLDGWLRDGSAAHVESLCEFPAGGSAQEP